MKKLIFTAATLLIAVTGLRAQESAGAEDSKVRFGLRITPQPCWFVSGDKNSTPAGSIFGYGFGLNIEFRLTSTAAFLTGIGGDFEGGKYTVKNEPGVYQVAYWMNSSSEFVKPENGPFKGNTGYHLNERQVNTTMISIPLLLKLMTKEYNGLKYFGNFGGELGIRAKATAKDTYYSTTTYKDNGLGNNADPTTITAPTTVEDINISDEASSVPMRLGMNLGIGTEYRLGGSTSLFFSVNYFRSFTNLMQEKSDFSVFGYDGTNFQFVRTDLKQAAIRINIGIMF